MLNPCGIFIDSNNTVYIASSARNQILVWSEGSSRPTRTISSGLSSPQSVFVNINGDIYVDNGNTSGRVDMWTLNATNSTPIMYVSGQCDGLFIDIKDNLYCSIGNINQVIAKSLNDLTPAVKIVAGSGCRGQAPDQLSSPTGIFVDINLDLYVADTYNSRVQRFESGNLNGTTVTGGPLNVGIKLKRPTGIVLDADSYLFIVDSSQNLIFGQGPNGFRCIAGCSASGSGWGQLNGAQQLSQPWAMSFDSYGNIYVVDRNNNRIQNFLLVSNDSGNNFYFPLKELSELHSTLS